MTVSACYPGYNLYLIVDEQVMAQFLAADILNNPTKVHEPLDEQEALFWVLIWNLVCFTDIGLTVDERSRILESVFDGGRFNDGDNKIMFLRKPTFPPPAEKFGERTLLRSLIIELKVFFASRYPLGGDTAVPVHLNQFTIQDTTESAQTTSLDYMLSRIRRSLANRDDWPMEDGSTPQKTTILGRTLTKRQQSDHDKRSWSNIPRYNVGDSADEVNNKGKKPARR